MKILPIPFPITYILGWHQHKISQKEQVIPELKAVEVLPRPSPITYILSSKKKHVLEQEILLAKRPMCLRQKNVKKKECSPPSERDLRLGLLIILPNSLSFNSRDFLWYFSGCKRRHCIPWLGLLHNSCTQKQEKISEFSSGVLSSRNIPLIYPVWVRSSMIILPKTPSTMSCKTLISVPISSIKTESSLKAGTVP